MVSQLNLFSKPEPIPEDKILQRDILYVRVAIRDSSIPMSFDEIMEATEIRSKDRVFKAISALHKSGEIGWASRATIPPVSRGTDESEQPNINDSEVARPDDEGGSPTVKVKAFKKAGSELFYYYVCYGKEKSCRAYLGGGNIETHLAQVYKARAEQAIIDGRFNGCVSRSDYYRVIGQLKSEVEF